MRTSQNGLNLIKQFEGLRLKAYKCVAGVWTIGYGHTGSDVHEGLTINEKQAEDLLRNDLGRLENYVNNKNYVPQTLNQNQFDALVSFAFNLGQGNLKELCNNRKNKTLTEVAKEIPLYNKANKKFCQGLANRRAAELQLFLS